MSATNPNTPPTPLYCYLWWWLKRIPLHKKSDHDLGPATMAKDRSFPPCNVLHRGVLSKTLWKQKVKVKIRVIVKHIAAEVSGSHQRSLGLPWQRLNTTPSHCSKMYMWDERDFLQTHEYPNGILMQVTSGGPKETSVLHLPYCNFPRYIFHVT